MSFRYVRQLHHNCGPGLNERSTQEEFNTTLEVFSHPRTAETPGKDRMDRRNMCQSRQNRGRGSQVHRRRFANIWKLSLNCSGKKGPMNQKSDYAEPVRAKNRPHKEAREESSHIHPSQRTRQRKHLSLRESTGRSVRTAPKIGWTWYSGSPSFWWHSSRQARGNASQQVLHSSSCDEW